MKQKNKRKITIAKITMAMLTMGILLLAKGKDAKAGIVSTNHEKYSYKEYVKDIEQLQKKYPEQCLVKEAGTTADNRKIYEIVLGNPEAKKHLVVMGNLHAREYMTIQLCMKQIERYLERYDKKVDGVKIKDTLNEVAIHYFPSCNPDGTAISQYGFKAIRNKTLRRKLYKMSGSTTRWKANARGVDLNRNWNAGFKKSGKPNALRYSGTKPESEKEVKALLKAVNSMQETGKVVGIVSYHSTGSIIYGKCMSIATKGVKKTTTKMYKLAKKLTGYKIMPADKGIKLSGGYSREYFLYKRNIPFITIEVGVNPCPLSAKEFPSIWKKNKDLVIKEAMLFD